MATGVSGYLSQYYQTNAYYPQYGGMYIKPHFVEEYNVEGNYSRIKIDYIEFQSSMYSQSVSWSVIGKININGTTYQYSGTVNTAGYNATRWTCAIVSDPIYHNADGSKAINITLTYSYCASGQVGAVWENSGHLCSAAVTLTTIPRKSSLTASNGTLGTAQTLTINRESSNFAHSIRYKCGTSDVALVTKTTSTSISFTPPLTLAKQNTTGTSVSITFTLYTFESAADDAKEIGTTTKTITCAIPDSVKPSCSLSVEDVTGYADTFGGCVQGQSKLEIIVTPTLAYESPIASYSVSADGKTYGYSDIETPALTNSGTLAVNATVKDQRGRSGSASKSITVLPYSPPAISKLAVARCNSDGSANDMGTHCKVTYSFAITSLSSKNAKTVKLKYKKTSETAYTTVSLTSAYSATDATYVFAADESASFNVAIELTDSFTSSSLATSVSTAQVPMHLGSDGVSIAFGKLCEKTGYEFGKKMYDRFGTSVCNGIAEYGGNGNMIDADTTLEQLIITTVGTPDDSLWYVQTMFYNSKSTSSNRAQIAFPYRWAGNIFFRYYNSGAWSAWVEFAKASEVIKKTELLDLVYPVNSIYISYSHTSPASLFGGTWTRVYNTTTDAGVFLYGCTAAGVIGEFGGAAENTHYHFQTLGNDGTSIYMGESGTSSDTRVLQNVKSAYQTSNNVAVRAVRQDATYAETISIIPPFVKVSIWRRTA